MSQAQDVTMRQILGQLEALSSGTTQSWNPSGGHTSDPTLPITLSTAGQLIRQQKPPHEYWRARYEECDSDGRRENVITKARNELKQWRGRLSDRARANLKLLTDAQILDEEILAAEGWTIADVAFKLRCTETRVRKVRLAAGISAADGKRAALSVADVDVRQQVRDLADRGMTERQIKMLTGGTPTSTIRRILGRAA